MPPYTFRLIIMNWTNKQYKSNGHSSDSWLLLDGPFDHIPPASPSWLPASDRFQPGVVNVFFGNAGSLPDKMSFEDYVWDFDGVRIGVAYSTKTPVPQVQCHLSDDAAKSYVSEVKAFNLENDVIPDGQERLSIIKLTDK